MSAASNVTGIITDTKVVARIAHKYGAWVVFDYAAGGKYNHRPCMCKFEMIRVRSITEP